MKAKKQKNGIKVLLSLVIAITMIGIPASVFTVTAETPSSGGSEHIQTIPVNDINLPTEPKAGADPYGIVKLVNESFESWVPTGWTAGDNWTQNTSVNHTGDACAMRNATPPGPYGTDVYSTLCVDVNATGMHDVALTYYARTDSYNDLNCTIDVDGTVVDYCNISSANRTTWIPFTVNLSAYDGTIFTLCFNYSDPGNDAQWLLDDVVVTGDNHPTGIDIAVNGLVNLTCGGRYNTAPKYIEASVANYGQAGAYGVPFHFQIYQEKPLELEQYKLWNMESCVLRTWEAYNYDSGANWSTWTWTEKRSHSPTHSWHTQPDSLDTYEAYSDDSLILKDWFHVNSTVDGNTVSAAYLTFAHWCQGEFDGTNPIDYGTVYVINSTGRYKVGGPYYDTSGEWQLIGDGTSGNYGIDISDWIGQDIKIEFNWIADGTGNYEGWYIDDVNIDYSYNSLQPLVWSDYQYADLPAGTETVIKSQLPWDAIQDDANYYIQVYYANNMSSYIDDYDLFNNEINCSVWFGDVCDAAVTNIVAPDDVILDHNVGYKEIPINVTVYNNGTLAEDIPVTVTAQHKLTNIVVSDDFETSTIGDEDTYDWMTVFDPVWDINDYKYYTPFKSLTTYNPGTGTYNEGFGIVKMTGPIDVRNMSRNGDVVFHTTWNLGPDAGVVPVMITNGNEWRWLVNTTDVNQYNPGILGPFWFHNSSSGWTDFSLSEFIRNNDIYWEHNNYDVVVDPTSDWHGSGDATSFTDLCWNMYELTGLEKYLHPEIGFLFEGDVAGSPGEGFWIDDIKVVDTYPGATVWTETKTIHLNPNETGYLNFTWNATEYCDYIITGAVALDCDIDPTNDKADTSTRIHEWLYKDNYEKVEFDDNTCGLPDDWHIVQECSICPDDHFWWNGVDSLGTYEENRDDTLQIKEAFNFSGMSVSEAYFNFSAYYYMEADYDYGYVEVSNDSGVTWFILDTLNNNTNGNWIDVNEHLVPTVTTLTSPATGLTDFIMPGTFFTENMMFRFRFTSDSGVNWKGWYIDNVNLTIFNATWNTIFFDDMENGDALWTHGYICYGNHWHAEDNFGMPYPGTDGTAWWNGDNRTWMGSGVAGSWGSGAWDGWTANDILGNGGWGFYFGYGYAVALPDSGYADENAWLNTTIDFSAYTSATFYFYMAAGWQNVNHTMNVTTWYVTVTDGTTTINYPYVHPMDDNFYAYSMDLSPFAGSSSVTIGFHYNVTGAADHDVYLYCPFAELDVVGPTIPDHQYYNNVDEKLILEFDLTHAYEAILHWEQNYSFAENDLGYVDVWTGSEWKTLLVNKGSSPSWSASSLDISNYIDHEGLTKIRFRFVSDSSGADYGWLVDNVSIDGKVDYKAPTCTASLSPATPDGNNGWYKSSVTVTLTADDNVKMGTIYYRINGGSWLVYTAPFTISNDGSYVIDYYAVDSVGNEGAHGSVSFKIDATAPTASISSPQAGYIYFFGRELMPRLLFKDKALIIGGLNAEATASDSTSGVFVVKFNEDGTTFAEDTSSPYSAPLPFALFAAHTLTATAEDFAGNTYTTPGVDYFKIF